MRDRQVALAFVRRREAKDARSVIAREMGVNLRTVYRAIERELGWAREQMRSLTRTDEDSFDTPPTEADGSAPSVYTGDPHDTPKERAA